MSSLSKVQKNLLIWATGEKEPGKGGSGARELIMAEKAGLLHANIVGLVSNYPNGGVHDIAEKFNKPFRVIEPPFIAENYQAIAKEFQADFHALSGFLKIVRGLPPNRTINIHPALPEFTAGLYGHFAHEAMVKAFEKGLTKISGMFMHFVTEEVDGGPPIVFWPIPMIEGDTPDILAERVNKREHSEQWYFTDLVVNEIVSWSGDKSDPIKVPEGYHYHEPLDPLNPQLRS